jgi:precorrin-2 dehydrogenase
VPVRSDRRSEQTNREEASGGRHRCASDTRKWSRVRPLRAASIESPVPVRHAYPIMLDVTDRPVVIVGGGTVAVRKATGLLDAGAMRVVCVSPSFDSAMPEAVERVEEPYETRHLEGAGLVFAATDLAAVNDAVVRDARARGTLVSRADVDEDLLGDFTVPAVWRHGTFALALSAGGNPALAVFVRDCLVQAWRPAWDSLAHVTNLLRPRLVATASIDGATRRAILRDLSSTDALEVLQQQQLDGLMKWLRGRHPELSKLPPNG